MTGQDWKPGAQPEQKPNAEPAKVAKVLYSGGGFSDAQKKELEKESTQILDVKIQNCGDVVRKLKANKADKSEVGKEVEVLLFLKNLYKQKSGEDWQPLEKREKENKKAENKQQNQNQPPKAEG